MGGDDRRRTGRTRAAALAMATAAVALAALTGGPSRALAAPAQTEAYAAYAAEIAASWSQFAQPNLEHLRTWWAGRAPARYATVFYPFSGPDLGNALAMFPDADTYVLFGLEPPGALPDLPAWDADTVAAGLTELKASLSTLLQVNYFFTRTMGKRLGGGSFNSITGVLLFFLAMSDCEVTGARRIAIAAGGAIAAGTAADDPASGRARIPGVELTFRRGRGKRQTIRYFAVNVADAELGKGSADFVPYLRSQGRLVTMIKSASYLLHQDGAGDPARFAQIRALILAQSDFVVQDDSGVPLRLFARDTWKLQFHGTYDAPTPEFGKYLQRDLKVEIQRNSTGKLPFSYGYAYKHGESNLMTAARTP